MNSPLPTVPTRTQTWTSYDKPRTVSMSGQFSYGADRGRFKQVNTFSGQTTLYVDGLYEKHTVGATDAHVHYIYAGGEAVAVYKSSSSGTQETLYLHRDQLGSVSEITDAAGVVVERLSYDPLGKRRDSDWSDSSSLSAHWNETWRAFTGRESLDDVALVHMGGRVVRLCRYAHLLSSIHRTSERVGIFPFRFGVFPLPFVDFPHPTRRMCALLFASPRIHAVVADLYDHRAMRRRHHSLSIIERCANGRERFDA